MDDIKQQLKAMLVPLLVLATIAFGLYLFLAALIDKLNSIGSDLSKAIIAGAVTVFAAAVSLVLGKIWEQHLKIKQEIREKKIPVYEEQIKTFFSIMFDEKCGKPKPTDQEIVMAIREFTEKMIIWGGPKVIKVWSDFRLADWQNSTPEEVFARIENLMRALRDDLGNSNKGLTDGDFIRLFVNDFGDPNGSDTINADVVTKQVDERLTGRAEAAG